MKYVLNKLPIPTTNSFNINDLKIDLNLPNDLKFKEFSSNDNIRSVVKKDFHSNIGLEFKEYLDVNIDIKDSMEPLLLTYYFDNNDCLIDNININYIDNSNRDIIIKYVSNDGGNHFHHLKLNINMANNSKGKITVVNLLNDSSSNFIASEIDLGDYSDLTLNILDVGGRVKVNNIKSNANKNAISNLNNIYIGINNDTIDMNYEYINKGSNSSSNIEVQGILNDYAKKKFRGTIDFLSGSKESVGNELENIILLSDNVINSSVPILLCGEEDVSGTHAISSGKIDKEQLFYLQSRGLDALEAKKVICMANFNRIIDKINNKRIQEEIIELLNKKIY